MRARPISLPSLLPVALLILPGVGGLVLVLVQGSMLGFATLGTTVLTAMALMMGRKLLSGVVLWLPLGVLLYPFVRYPREQTLVMFDRAWFMALLFASILFGLPATRTPIAVRRVETAGAVLAVIMGIRALTTKPSLVGSVETWIDAIFLPLVLFEIVRRTAGSARARQQLAGAAAIAGGFCAGLGIAEKIFGFELASLSGGAARYDVDVGGIVRVSGPYPVPEVYALVLVITLAATLFWMQARPTSSRLLPGALALVQAAGLAISLFRVAWIAGLVVVTLGLGFRPRRAMRSAGAVTLLVLVTLLSLPTLQNNRVFVERLHDTRNVSGRFATHQVGLEMFYSSPWTGVGVNQFAAEQQKYPAEAVNGVRSVTFPHSSYLAVLAENGIAGFAALAWLSISTGFMLRRLWLGSHDPPTATLAAVSVGGALGYLLFSLTLTMLPYGPSNAFFAVLMGMAAAALGECEPSNLTVTRVSRHAKMGPREGRRDPFIAAGAAT